jgi:hypothetical protein
MGAGVPHHRKPLAATVAVDPEFFVKALYIVPVEQVIGPFRVAELFRSRRSGDAVFATEVKLDLVSDAAIWTRNSKH